MREGGATARDTAWGRGEQHTVVDLLRRRLERDPDGEYLDVVGAKLSAAELDRTANRVAASLAELGVGRGDRVAGLLDNSPEAVLFWWAAVKLGAVAVPTNTAFKGEYLRHQLADSGASVLVAQGDLAARVAGVAPQVPSLRHVVWVGAPEADVSDAHPHRWQDLVTGDADDPGVDPRPSDLATLIYTGGTTGPSKGCMLSHNYHVSLADQATHCWGRQPDDVLWTPLPLFHFNALAFAVVGTLRSGGRAAIARRFSVSRFWRELNRTSATLATLLGSMVHLLAHDEERPEMAGSGAAQANRSLRLLVAVPLPTAIDTILRERFRIETFSGGYATTEAGMISWLPPGRKNPPGAAGVVNSACFDVRIFDDDDDERPAGEAGEIVVRPRRPHVMFEGYWQDPGKTVRASRNWWFHTGDVGRIDADGTLTFVDRKADYLRRRGENISSFEVERILLDHPALAEVAVHAMPSELTEDDLKLTAVCRPGVAADEQALFLWCVDRLPYFALPRYVEFREELPRSPTGRVLKRVLREEGVTARTWDAERAGVRYERR